MIADWSVIVGAAWAICIVPLWLHPLLLAAIAARQHALLALMHDGSHYMFHSDKRWNDVIADLFCAFPFLITVRGYRANHIVHHDRLNTPHDPDLIRKIGASGRFQEWMFPASWRDLGRLILRDISGLGMMDSLRSVRMLGSGKGPDGRKKPVREEYRYANAVRLSYFVVAAVLVWMTGRPMTVLYAWFAPFCFVLPALLRLRSMADHFALPKNSMLDSSRNVFAPAWELFLLSPHNINLHLTHHLFPYVPWYNLPELHRRLQRVPQYRDGAYANRSFLFGKNSVLADIMSVSDDPRALLDEPVAQA
jgi:fatty acid desaturase